MILAILSVWVFITAVILYLLLLTIYNSSVFGQAFRMEHQYIKHLDFVSKYELHQNNILILINVTIYHGGQFYWLSKRKDKKQQQNKKTNKQKQNKIQSKTKTNKN